VSIVVLTGLALTIAYVRGVSLLWPPKHHFIDLLLFQEQFRHFGSITFFTFKGAEPWTYPATMALLYKLYYSSPWPLFSYFCTTAAVVIVGAGLLMVALRNRGVSYWIAGGFVLTAIVTSYPLWFLIECANLELFLILFVGAGIVCYMKQWFWWAAALFGVAAALKLFPVIYLGLFLSRQHYRKLGFGLGVGFACFVAAHWIMGPDTGIAWWGTYDALARYQQFYVLRIRPAEIEYDHSLFTLVKQGCFALLAWRGRVPISWEFVYRAYLLVAAAGASYPFLLLVRKMPPLNQALAISACALLLPPVSYDYRLMHMYVPWAFLVLFIVGKDRRVEAPVLWLLAMFAVLFTPQSFLKYSVRVGEEIYDSGFAAQVKVVALLAIFWIAALYPMGGEAPLSEPVIEE
jgi:hypothetical protein